VEAIEKVRSGRNVVIATGTASGKTLCYNLPVAETLLREPSACALYLFPTKALAQDQLRVLRAWTQRSGELGRVLHCGAYDGDTPQETRRQLRERGNLILSNPDMLHQGILPNHSRWARYLSRLRYVVLDEIHTYRGVFGSNVACLLRRLSRICYRYQAEPQFICCSATIANPGELAENLVAAPVEVVSQDGSPRGPKYFVFWNPPYLDAARLERRSSNVEAERLMLELIRRGVQTIAFVRARIVAEILYRYLRQALSRHDRRLAEAIRPYRAGYLPQERREIERRLFSGELLGVTATNALELGIDIGGLDAALLVGYPQTIASTWQQVGRAGRGQEEALAILIAYNDAIDQYLMRHPEYFFGQSPENAVLDPSNPHLLRAHLRCAAYEMPLSESDLSRFGAAARPVAERLEAEGELKRRGQEWVYTGQHFPAARHSLRTLSADTFTIVDASDRETVIGNVDAISAPELVYPQAIYLHEGNTYFVRHLDFEAKVAYVDRMEVDYYTQAVLEANLRAGELREQKTWRKSQVCFGEATVSWRTVMFKKIKFYQLDSIGYGTVDLPAQHLETTALWLIPHPQHLESARRAGRNPYEGLAGVRNVAIQVLPLFAMCDRGDLGGIVDASNFGAPTIFLYDRYPGGPGFAHKAYELLEPVLEACLRLIEECPCQEGCPSCVGLPLFHPAQHTDPDLWGGYPIPDKEAARLILASLLEREAPPPQPRPQPTVSSASASPEPGPRASSLAKRLGRGIVRRRRGG